MSVADAVRGIHDVTIVAKNVAELRTFFAKLDFKQLA